VGLLGAYSISYHEPIQDIQEINNLNKWTSISASALDRETRYFYDKDNLLVGEQTLCGFVDSQPIGFTKKYERDGAGNIFHEIVYRTKSPMASNLPDACPKDERPLHTWYWYDNAGRKIATWDADWYLTTYSYFGNGKLRAECRFSTAKTIDTSTRRIDLPAINESTDEVIEHDYDDLGRENRIVNKFRLR
jgi:YD repeat-containing protein